MRCLKGWLSHHVPPIALVLFFLTLIARSTSADPGTEPTFDEVKKLLLAQHARLDSLLAEYRSWHENSPETLVTCEAAAQGAARYESLWHGSRNSRAEDRRSYTRFYDGKQFNIYYFYDKYYEVAQRVVTPQHLSKVRDLTLFQFIGWWPATDPTRPPLRDGKPETIPEILRNHSARLIGKGASADGKACLILELPAAVRLWIDPTLGLVRRREELRTGAGGRIEVLATYDFSDFRLHDGVWLPYQVRRQIPSEGIVTHHQVDRYRVNAELGDTFRFDPPPGTLVYDRDTDLLTQIPGGLDGLKMAAARLIAETRGASLSAAIHKSKLRTLTPAFLSGLCVTLIVRAIGRTSARQIGLAKHAPSRPATCVGTT